MNPMLLVGIFLVGFGVAWSWQGVRADAELADLRLEQSTLALDAVMAQARKLQGERTRADLIFNAAQKRESTLDQQLQETQYALRTATTGRPCLGGAALRLLDHSTGLTAPAGPLSAGLDGGRSAGPAADSQSSSDVATDTDVSQWIATAGRYYDACRNRIKDIRDYDQGRPEMKWGTP